MVGPVRNHNPLGLTLFTDPQTLAKNAAESSKPVTPSSAHSPASEHSPASAHSPASLFAFGSRRGSIPDLRQALLRRNSSNVSIASNASNEPQSPVLQRRSSRDFYLLTSRRSSHDLRPLTPRRSSHDLRPPSGSSLQGDFSALALRSKLREFDDQRQKLSEFIDDHCRNNGISDKHRNSIHELAKKMGEANGEYDTFEQLEAAKRLASDLINAHLHALNKSSSEYAPLRNLAEYVYTEVYTLYQILGESEKKQGENAATLKDHVVETARTFYNDTCAVCVKIAKIAKKNALSTESISKEDLEILMKAKKWTTEAWIDIFYVNNGGLKCQKEIDQLMLAPERQWAFHTTPYRNIPSIWKTGLDTSRGGKEGGGACATGGDERLQEASHKFSQGVIALAKDNETILPYLHMFDVKADLVIGQPGANYPAILRLQLSKVFDKQEIIGENTSRLTVDPMHHTALLSSESIPAEHLQILTTVGWIPLQGISYEHLVNLNAIYESAQQSDRMLFTMEQFGQLIGKEAFEGAFDELEAGEKYKVIQDLKGEVFTDKAGSTFRFVGTTGHPLHSSKDWGFVVDLLKGGDSSLCDQGRAAFQKEMAPMQIELSDPPPEVDRTRRKSTASSISGMSRMSRMSRTSSRSSLNSVNQGG